MSSGGRDTMRLGLTDPLRAQVQRKFAQARAAGDLQFSDTELSILRSKNDVPFQLRFCPGLASKPKGPKVPDWSKPKSRVDPFANPSPDLLISRIPRDGLSHVLVLNKFPVIPNHFIIATKDNHPQTDLLEPGDLGVTYACIKAWEEASGEREAGQLFAFFNSGEHSGASQVHRHLQFLPCEDMLVGSESNHGWQLLIHSMTTRAHPQLPLLYNPALPFIHFAIKLEGDVTTSTIYSTYLMLMRSALSATKSPSDKVDEDVQIARSGSTTFSYNLALTRDTIAICPRRSESASIPGLDDNHEVSINGTLLGGTMMVKNEQEWNTLRKSPHMLDGILEAIGYPWHAQHEATASNL